MLESHFKLKDHSGNIIPWSINRFPDGQIQFVIDKLYIEDDYYEYIDLYASLPTPECLDLFFQMIYVLGHNLSNVKVLYLYGARSDKDFAGSHAVCNVSNLTLVRIHEECAGINVSCLAPHSFTGRKLGIDADYKSPAGLNFDEYDLIVFPDESAKSRYLGPDLPFIICEKERDQVTGKIVSHKIPSLPSTVKKVLLYDDLCDAGNSFVNISQTLPAGVIADLFVFHGVFSYDAPKRLAEAFINHIFVTNSLPESTSDLDKEKFTVFDVW